jgi:SNF2 family DNA or RNA helicase
MQLMQHQQRFVEIMQRRTRFAWFAEPGVGKTHGTLAAIADAKGRGYAGCTVVLAPKSILWSAWAEDAKHHPLTVQVCWHASAARRSALIKRPADLYIINPASFKRHVQEFLDAGVTRIVVDESSCLKDPDSQISKTVFDFSRRCDSAILLSGTPAPNDDTEYFGQVRCVDPRLFGASFYRFAYEYFVPVKRTIQNIERIIGWRANPLRRSEFVEKLKSVSWVLRTSDCIDLPEATDAIRHIELSDEEQRVYTALLDDLRVEWDDGQATAVSLNARTMKLRQVLGGHVYDSGRVRQIGKSKLQALDELLGELGTNQVVIWAEFTAEIDMIVDHLDGRASVGRIDGSVPAEVRAELIRDFQAGRLRYLVCHPAAAGHGITLTAAHYDCYYSLSFSLEQHEQSRKRTHRTGQTWPVTHFYLIARGTVDEQLLAVLRRKAGAAEAMKDLLSGNPNHGRNVVSRNPVQCQAGVAGDRDLDAAGQADAPVRQRRGSGVGSAWQ